jgi:hypothetical protein
MNQRAPHAHARTKIYLVVGGRVGFLEDGIAILGRISHYVNIRVPGGAHSSNV